LGSPLQRTVRVNRLFDTYGALLTERQRQVVSLYYHQDLSLAEIAKGLQVTRQAVHDSLARAVGAMEEFENDLQVLQQAADASVYLREGMSLVEDIDSCLARVSDEEPEPRCSVALVEQSRQQLEQLYAVIGKLIKMNGGTTAESKGGKIGVREPRREATRRP